MRTIVATVDNGAVTRSVFARGRSLRGGRAGFVLAVVAVVLGGVAVLVWWRPFGWATPRLGWNGAEQASWIAGIVSAVLSIVSAIASVVALRHRPEPTPGHHLPDGPRDLVPPAFRARVPTDVVPRRREFDLVKAAVLRPMEDLNRSVTVIRGGGGFGKTVLAEAVCLDADVAAAFPGGILRLTPGRRTADQGSLLKQINDIIQSRSPFLTLETAADRLAELLDRGPDRLMLIDDVWGEQQAELLTRGGFRCARLITTRSDVIGDADAAVVEVGTMTPREARAVLTTGGIGLDEDVVSELVALTGRWPLLMHLVHRYLIRTATGATDAIDLARRVCARLSTIGPADAELDAQHGPLNLDDPRTRALAVKATVDASTDLLPPNAAKRFQELSVFFDSQAIPVSVIARLWEATGGTDLVQTRRLCLQLGELGLVEDDLAPEPAISLHNVVRDMLRSQVHTTEMTRLHHTLLMAYRPQVNDDDLTAPWWTLDDSPRFMWDHLIDHLMAVGRTAAADQLATDLRWVSRRLVLHGPLACHQDLRAAGSERCRILADGLVRAAHLLHETDPPHAVTDVLCSRMAHLDAAWTTQLTGGTDLPGRAHLVNAWPLPDLPDPRQVRLLTEHVGAVNAIAAPASGAWLASAGQDGTVRVWNPTSGRHLRVLDSPTGAIHSLVADHHGMWVAGANEHGAYVWDIATGNMDTKVAAGTETVIGDRATDVLRVDARGRMTLLGPDRQPRSLTADWLLREQDQAQILCRHSDRKCQIMLSGDQRTALFVAFGPKHNLVATAPREGGVTVWSSHTRGATPSLSGHRGAITGLAPLGSTMVASCGVDGTVRVWDPTAHGHHRVLPLQTTPLSHLLGGDEESFVTGDHRGTVMFWERDGMMTEQWQKPAGRPPVLALATDPHGRWLATARPGIATQVWERTDRLPPDAYAYEVGGVPMVSSVVRPRWRERFRFTDAGHELTAMAASDDGEILALAYLDGTVRLHTTTSGDRQAAATLHLPHPSHALAWSTSDRYLITGTSDGAVLCWDRTIGASYQTPCAHGGPVRAVAAEASLVATGADDGSIQILTTDGWASRPGHRQHTGAVRALALTSDGRLLASAGDDHGLLIWDTAEGQAVTLMRTELPVTACYWRRDSPTLRCGGPGGLYSFNLHFAGLAPPESRFRPA